MLLELCRVEGELVELRSLCCRELLRDHCRVQATERGARDDEITGRIRRVWVEGVDLAVDLRLLLFELLDLGLDLLPTMTELGELRGGELSVAYRLRLR